MSSAAAASPQVTPATRELVRALSLRDAIALVLSVIGTGVFLKTAPMAQLVGSPSNVLLAWLAAGLLSLAGALTYAELGAMMPEAGGEYVFLREAYGDLPAFRNRRAANRCDADAVCGHGIVAARRRGVASH